MHIELRNVAGTVLETHELDPLETLADNLIRIWPSGHPHHGKLIQDAEGFVFEPNEAICHYPDGNYHLVLLPLGPAILGIPLAMWILVAVSIIATVILTPKPPSTSSPDSDFEDGTSNQIANQTNRLRPSARLPEVFGKVKVTPDLIAEPYSRYFGRDQRLFELFVVSNGFVDCTNHRLHTEDLEDYDQNVEVIHPGEQIPARFRVVTENRTVSDLELSAANETFSSAIGLDIDNGAGTISADQYIWGPAWETKLIFLTSTVDANNEGVYTVTARNDDGTGPGPYNITVTPSPPTTRNDDGSAVYYALQDNKVTAARSSDEYFRELIPAAQDDPAWWTAIEQGDVILADLTSKGLGYVQVRIKKKGVYRNQPPTNQNDFFHSIFYAWLESDPGGGNDDFDFWVLRDSVTTEPDADSGGFRNWTQWYELPETDSTEIWWDLAFKRGLYQQKAGNLPGERTVDVQIQYRKVGDSTVYNRTKSITEKTRNLLRYSMRERDLEPAKWEARFRRITDFEEETSTLITLDEVVLFRLASARQPEDRTLKDCTAVFLELNTQLNEVGGTRKYNCVAERWLPVHDPDPFIDPTGASGTGLAPDSSIAAAVSYTLINQAGYDPADIDLVGLFQDFGGASQDFRGVIDQEMSADEQVATLMAVGNGFAYRRAGVVYFHRDVSQSVPRALFNRRNKVDFETKSMSFGQLDRPDAVEVTFKNEDDNFNETVVQYPDNITPLRPKRLKLIGKTQWNKAWRRAYREWLLIQHRTDTLEVRVAEEGALINPGDRIAVTDHLRKAQAIDGQLVSASGKTIILDRDPGVIMGGSMCLLRDKDGVTIQKTTVDTNNGTTVILTENVTVTRSAELGATTGILYHIIIPGDEDREDWIVDVITPQQDGSVNLQCVNYAEEVYLADSATPPDPP